MTTELEDYLEQNDIAKACEKIEILQKSLVAQLGLPGQNERHSQVESFKNRMEALTSAAVVNSFSTKDIGNSFVFTKNMHCSFKLYKFYRKI